MLNNLMIMQDTATLGVVVVKHCGFTAVVKVPVEAGFSGSPVGKQDLDIEEQPEGGSNALNVNRYTWNSPHISPIVCLCSMH